LKLRIKVKHLFAGAFLTAAALVLFQFVVAPKLQLSAAVQDYESGKAGGKTGLLAAIDSAASETKRRELIRQYMIGSGSESPSRSFDVYVGPGSVISMGAPYEESRLWSWEEKLPYLLEYATGGTADIDRIGAVNQLVRYYKSEGRTEDGLALLERTEMSFGGDWAKKLKLERAKLVADAGDAGEAMRLAEELEAEPAAIDKDLSGKVVAFKAQLLVGQGKAKEALESVDRELAATERWMAEQKETFPDMGDYKTGTQETLTALREQLVRALEDETEASADVSGTVRRSDGKPMARVGVFLRAERDVSHSITEGEPYQTLTDAQGRYEFKNVIPGSYQLYLGLLHEQIDGWTYPTMNDDWIDVGDGDALTEDVTLRPLIEIREPANDAALTGKTMKFSWEPVDGAAYYTLYGTLPVEGGTTSTPILSRTAGSSVELPVHVFYETAGGYSYRDADGKREIDPVGVLGYSNPNLRYSWYVEAYDAGGRLITRSNGYRLNERTMGRLPFFYLKERALTDADELLMEGRMDEALAEYKKAYGADPQDRHSLHMIVRIYGAQASMANRLEWREEEIPYLKRMVELDPGKSSALFSLFEFYENKKNWSDTDEYYGMYVKANGGKPDAYAQSRYATALMKQRRTEEATMQFREAMERDPSHRFVGNFLAAELYAGRSFAEVSKLAEAYPERAPYETGAPVWKRLIGELERESAGEGNAGGYGATLKKAMSAVFDDDGKAIGEIRRPALKAFADALRNVN